MAIPFPSNACMCRYFCMAAENVCGACRAPVFVAGAFRFACLESFGGVTVPADDCLSGVGLRPYFASNSSSFLIFGEDTFSCPLKRFFALESVLSLIPRLPIADRSVSCLIMLLVKRFVAPPYLGVRFVSFLAFATVCCADNNIYQHN